MLKIFFNASFLAITFHQLASFAYGSPIDFSFPNAGISLKTKAPTNFIHPGVFLNAAQLNFIKSKINSDAQPWTNDYNKMLGTSFGSLTRAASPTATVECGPSSTPDNGCSDEKEDALAAYAMSLAWYITGSVQYAQKAISYMNAWARTIKAHTNSNAPLQTGWAGANWARAAEIIRHTNAGWSLSDVTAFEDTLRNVYLPTVIVGSNSNGNWELGN